MKKNLFLLVVGLLSSVMSFAQPEGWNDPATSLAKTTTIIADGSTVYYLKNETVENWFIASNSWGTEACVSAKDLTETETPYGYKIRFKDTTTHEGFYQMEDAKENSFKYFFDNNGSIYTDYNNQGIDKTYWKFTFDGDNNCTFVSYMNQNKKVGLVSSGDNPATGSKGDYTINNAGTEVATTWSLWSMGAPEAVAEWNAGNALWNRMQEIFDESKEAFDVSPYAEQIGEQKGTLENAERLKSVLAKLNADYQAWQIEHATPETPADVTELYIVNPDFETGNTNGWTYKTSNDHGAKSTTNDTYKMTGSSGAYLFNIWSAGNEVSQTSKPIPVGVYKLTAVMATDAGHDMVLTVGEKTASKPAVDKGTGVLIELPFVVDAENEGLKIAAVTADNYWYKVDNFKLYYTGTSAESYAATFNETYEGKASKQYVSGLAAKVAAVRTAEGDEAIQAAYKAAKEYEDSTVAENIAAWAKYEQTLVDAQKLVDDPQFSDYTDKLASMLQQRATIADDDLSTSEVNDENTAVQTEMNNVKSHIQPGTDISDTYLKNADFTQDLVSDPTKGWVVEGTRTDGCNWRISKGDKCGECWNGKDFDFYQIVENAPVGVYQIQVQGFTRAGRGAASWGYYFNTQTGELLPQPNFNNWTPNKANVYLNDNTGDLSISYAYGHTAEEAFFTKTDTYTDPLGQYIYPDGMGSAGESFAAGEYTVSAFGLVAKQGDPLRIGVKGNNYGLDNWTIFANFKLIYQGFQADIIEPEFTKAVASLETAHIGTELQAKLQDLKSRAGAVSHSDGKAMFNMLSEIYAFNTEKESSEEVFAELNQQIKDLEDALVKYKDTASEQALTDAKKLQGQAADAYEDEETLLPTVTTEAATTIIGQIGKAIEALKIPKDSGSDDDPVDFTSVIKNANMASATGWTDAESNMTVDGTNKVAEFFNKENYNVYQKFTGLPAGVYEIQVQSFYRAGEIAQDWPAVVAGTESAPALYSIVESEGFDPEVFECPVRHISAEAINEDPSIDGTTSFKPFAEQGDETPWYMPNNLASTSQFFAAGDFYVNKIYFAIYTPSDTITIGLKKQGPATTNDWCAFSNWKLIGYGFESAKWDYLGAQTHSCDPVTPVFNPHAPLTALITEATTYYESIANNEEYKEVAAELKGAIDTAILVNDNTEATQQELDDAVTALQDALDKAKKATSISEVGAKAVKKLANGKYFKNGKLFIIKNGKIFTATGAIIK